MVAAKGGRNLPGDGSGPAGSLVLEFAQPLEALFHEDLGGQIVH